VVTFVVESLLLRVRVRLRGRAGVLQAQDGVDLVVAAARDVHPHACS
jgi:hypothetical protein